MTGRLIDGWNGGRTRGEKAIDAFIGSASRRQVTGVRPASTGVTYEDIAVEHHLLEVADREEFFTAHHIVTLASGLEVSFGEMASNGRRVRYTKPPGAINVYRAGLVPAVYPLTKTALIVCTLDPIFVESVHAEQESRSTTVQRERVSVFDESVASLLWLIEREARSGGVSGRLYRDHITHALVLRLLNVEARIVDIECPGTPLSRSGLNRVLDRMKAELDTDIDLKALAFETGYSKTHFLRIFRAATGYTPYQYLLQLRIGRAREMMRNKALHLLDIAMACGFSSHAQFSRMFRQMIGITPSEYRRKM